MLGARRRSVTCGQGRSVPAADPVAIRRNLQDQSLSTRVEKTHRPPGVRRVYVTRRSRSRNGLEVTPRRLQLRQQLCFLIGKLIVVENACGVQFTELLDRLDDP